MEPIERPTALSDEWRSYVAELRRSGEAKRPNFDVQLEAFREAYAGRGLDAPPPPAWTPNEEAVRETNIYRLMEDLGASDFRSLHRLSVEHRDRFWRTVLARLGIVFETSPTEILGGDDVRHPQWLQGSRYEITRSCFRADPNKPAIVYGREAGGAVERVSYRELELEVNRFASGLRHRGFEPGEAVALYMPMTPQCIAAYLGTIRAGCRVVSIADSFSVDELRKRLEIGHAHAIVTSGSYRRGGKTIDLYAKVQAALASSKMDAFAIVTDAPNDLGPRDVAWVDFLKDDAGVAEREGMGVGPHGTKRSPQPERSARRSRVAEREGVGVGPHGTKRSPYHVTNILFSSGTTGMPKAIPWTQLTPIKAAMDAHFHQDVHREDVLCWPTNIGWMMGPWLIYASLINRATMALYEGAPTGEGFHRFVVDSGVSVLGVVPSIVRAWRASETIGPGDWSRSRLRVFTSTGEASSFEDYLWLMSLADYRAPVIEYLGGTEIGGGHLTSTLLHDASPSTFRTPALGIDFVILDDEKRPVPEGESGEMFLVPPALGLSESLINKSDAEHDQTYYDGCPSGPNGETLRRHGDQVARLPGGYFKAEGRVDDTMNLGGIKVSSLEIERVVNEHQAVHESAAIAVPLGGDGAESLVVFAVLSEAVARGPGEEGLRSELKTRIATRLNPLFKLHDLVVVDQLPRTASNKILRRQLRLEYESRSGEART
jgi:acetyl-CoA synthetase